MRETRNAQASIFEFYSEHEHGLQLKALSELLDAHPDILDIVARDLIPVCASNTGAQGLSVESVLRCLLLKQILQVSYSRLSFHLADSATYRTFARLEPKRHPSRSTLQSTIRQISAKSLEKINQSLMSEWLLDTSIDFKSLRIDSTVVESNIAPPSDSHLLDDGIRVLSRLLAKSKDCVGFKLRIVDQRKRSRSLAFQIFHEKKAVKDALYPELILCANTTVKQVDRALNQIDASSLTLAQAIKWYEQITHYKALLLRIIDQTNRRVILKQPVPSGEKLVSLFEDHTDIIVKGARDVQYGHKVNLATQLNGFIAYLSIEEGNPSDKDLYLPALEYLKENHDVILDSTVADGGYATVVNAKEGRAFGVRQCVFHKRVGLGYHAMGVKKKTFKILRNFRAGVEGNISELKRAFGASKATWQGRDGFDAFVWASALSYNLMLRVRLDSS